MQRVDYAVALATKLDARLHVLHVVPGLPRSSAQI
jgi:nucleotide-binding universal stress UspA family protein